MFKRENVFFEDLLFRPFLDQKTCTVVFLFDQNLFGHNVSVWVRATKLNFCKRDIYMIMFRHEKLFFYEILLFRPETCMAVIASEYPT